jgi:hypothetical protein
MANGLNSDAQENLRHLLNAVGSLHGIGSEENQKDMFDGKYLERN